MFKDKTENVEVYFICYKKEDMELVETYYDEVLDTHCWYFNAYLAYENWKNKFKDINLTEISKMFLTVAASRYVVYCLENGEYKNNKEKKRLTSDLEKMAPTIKEIANEDGITSYLN